MKTIMQALDRAAWRLHRIALAVHRFTRRRLERSTDRYERSVDRLAVHIQSRKDALGEDVVDGVMQRLVVPDRERIADVRRYMAENPVEGL